MSLDNETADERTVYIILTVKRKSYHALTGLTVSRHVVTFSLLHSKNNIHSQLFPLNSIKSTENWAETNWFRVSLLLKWSSINGFTKPLHLRFPSSYLSRFRFFFNIRNLFNIHILLLNTEKLCLTFIRFVNILVADSLITCWFVLRCDQLQR